MCYLLTAIGVRFQFPVLCKSLNCPNIFLPFHRLKQNLYTILNNPRQIARPCHLGSWQHSPGSQWQKSVLPHISVRYNASLLLMSWSDPKDHSEYNYHRIIQECVQPNYLHKPILGSPLKARSTFFHCSFSGSEMIGEVNVRPIDSSTQGRWCLKRWHVSGVGIGAPLLWVVQDICILIK